jgi:hypothetical protein
VWVREGREVREWNRDAHDRHESKEKECRNKGVTTHHMESSVTTRALVIDVGTRCHHLRQLIRFAIPCTFDSLGTCGGWGHRQLALPPCLNSGLNSAPSLGGSIYCPHNHCFRVTLHCLLDRLAAQPTIPATRCGYRDTHCARARADQESWHC